MQPAKMNNRMIVRSALCCLLLWFLNPVFGLPQETDLSIPVDSQAREPTGTLKERVALVEQNINYFNRQQLIERIHDLQNTMSELTGLVEEQAHKINRLEKAFNALQGSSEELARDQQAKAPIKETLQRPPVAEKAEASGQQVKTEQVEKLDHNQAYKKAFELMQAKKYDLAIKAFNDYLSTYPQSIYLPNVNYWLGEIHLLYGHYDLAKKNFQEVIDKYPKHAKIPDALLKLAMIQRDSNSKQADILFKRLEQEFPTSTAAHLARVHTGRSKGHV